MVITSTKLLILILFIFGYSLAIAQQSINKIENNLYLNNFVGYGTENNYGNTAFFAGVTLSKPVTKHVFLELGLTGFTTVIYNGYTYEHGFKNNQQKYNALFLTPAVKYTFGSKEAFINAAIKAGPALKFYDYKILKTYMEYLYPDGRREPVPSTFQYYNGTKFEVPIYGSISFDAKVSPKLRLGIFLDTYSYAIPIEFFMPGINAIFKL